MISLQNHENKREAERRDGMAFCSTAKNKEGSMEGRLWETLTFLGYLQLQKYILVEIYGWYFCMYFAGLTAFRRSCWSYPPYPKLLFLVLAFLFSKSGDMFFSTRWTLRFHRIRSISSQPVSLLSKGLFSYSVLSTSTNIKWVRCWFIYISNCDQF